MADHCVKCGLCLPHCPTWRLLRDEADSPRGRISLIQGLASGELEPSPTLQGHLERCLACRSCELMCPAKVEFGQLLTTARATLHNTPPHHIRLLLKSIVNPRKLRRAASTLRLYQRSGAQWLVRKNSLFKGVKELEGLLPEIPEPVEFADHYPAIGQQRGSVGLFRGCLGAVMEGQIQHAAIRLLNLLGYAVHLPPSQGCCGSLHHHDGDTTVAQELSLANRNAFAGLELDAIVATASGCAAHLLEYQKLYGTPLPAPLFEVCDFLLLRWSDADPQPRLRSLPRRATLHTPCTQRNILRRPDAVEQLLSQIPQLHLEQLDGNDHCCGAAGSYMIRQPQIANRLRTPKVENAIKRHCELLISNNLGCALHLANGLRERGSQIEIIHPLLLLAESME